MPPLFTSPPCRARSKPLIHTDALAHNLARARAAAPDARVWAVVKANAYGHGIERAFAGLRGADGFALLDLAEAERLRALDWRGPILLLEGVFEPRDLELCSRLNLWHAVHCEQQIDWLAAPQDAPAAPRVPEDEQRHEPPGLHARRRSAQAWARLNALPQVDEISLMTHFSDADCSTTERHRPPGGRLRGSHAGPARRAQPGNSAATLRHMAGCDNAVRATGCAPAS
jgi:alanine racemase